MKKWFLGQRSRHNNACRLSYGAVIRSESNLLILYLCNQMSIRHGSSINKQRALEIQWHPIPNRQRRTTLIHLWLKFVGHRHGVKTNPLEQDSLFCLLSPRNWFLKSIPVVFRSLLKILQRYQAKLQWLQWIGDTLSEWVPQNTLLDRAVSAVTASVSLSCVTRRVSVACRKLACSPKSHSWSGL